MNFVGKEKEENSKKILAKDSRSNEKESKIIIVSFILKRIGKIILGIWKIEEAINYVTGCRRKCNVCCLTHKLFIRNF